MTSLHPLKIVGTVAAVLWFVALFGMFVKQSPSVVFPALAFVATILLTVALLSNGIALTFAKGWMKFGETLGKINGTVIFTLLFMTTLIPLSFLRKMTRSSSKNIRSNHKDSMFINRNHTYTSADLSKPW